MSLADIPSWAARYVGVPYVPGGRAATGADCWGLYSLVMAEQFGLSLPPYDGPNMASGSSGRAVAAAAEAYAKQFDRVEAADVRLGDAILIRVYGFPIHVGMVVGLGLMLHVEEYHSSVIARYTSTQWANRIVSFHRWTPNG